MLLEKPRLCSADETNGKGSMGWWYEESNVLADDSLMTAQKCNSDSLPWVPWKIRCFTVLLPLEVGR